MSTLNIQLLYRRSKRFHLIIHHLLPDLAPGLTLSDSNYPYLNQIFMVPKRFEPSKFDCLHTEMVLCLNGVLKEMIKSQLEKRWSMYIQNLVHYLDVLYHACGHLTLIQCRINVNATSILPFDITQKDVLS